MPRLADSHMDSDIMKVITTIWASSLMLPCKITTMMWTHKLVLKSSWQSDRLCSCMNISTTLHYLHKLEQNSKLRKSSKRSFLRIYSHLNLLTRQILCTNKLSSNVFLIGDCSARLWPWSSSLSYMTFTVKKDQLGLPEIRCTLLFLTISCQDPKCMISWTALKKRNSFTEIRKYTLLILL